MRASPDFIRREIVGEYLLVPTGAAAARINGLVTLNELGDYIFRKLADEQTEQSLLAAIVSEYDVDNETARADLRDFLSQMRQIGALEEQA